MVFDCGVESSRWVEGAIILSSVLCIFCPKVGGQLVGGGGLTFAVGGTKTAFDGIGDNVVPDAAEKEPSIGGFVCCTRPSAGTACLLLPLT